MPFIDGEYHDFAEIVYDCHCDDGYTTNEETGEQTMCMACAGEGKVFYTERDDVQGNSISSDIKPYHGQNQGCLLFFTILVCFLTGATFFLC